MANSGGRLDEARCACEVVMPLLTSVAALHAQGIVHRDIKPEHVVCACGTTKILDFQEAAQLAHKNLNHRAGQKEYMAPEVLDKPNLADVFHQVRARWHAWCVHGHEVGARAVSGPQQQ